MLARSIRPAAFGGGQIGYNFQRGNIVFGLETDLEGSGIRWQRASVGLTSSAVTGSARVRGRVGYAFDRALVYATGGFGLWRQVANWTWPYLRRRLVGLAWRRR